MAELVSGKPSAWTDGAADSFHRVREDREWPPGSTHDEHHRKQAADRRDLDRVNLHGVHSLSTTQLRSSLEAYMRECKDLRSERNIARDRAFRAETLLDEERTRFEADRASMMADLKRARQDAERARMREELRPELQRELTLPTRKAPVFFQDHLGRRYKFPFEKCEAWRDMRSLIWHAYDHDLHLQERVADDEAYDLLGPENEIILQQYWKEVIRPGMLIRLQFWPEKTAELLDLDDILAGGRNNDDADDGDEDEDEDDDDDKELDTYDVVSLDDVPHTGRRGLASLRASSRSPMV